eukprot:COSAG02_NODE_6418_length_3586_cov_1.351018_3_plen_81_part_00
MGDSGVCVGGTPLCRTPFKMESHGGVTTCKNPKLLRKVAIQKNLRLCQRCPTLHLTLSVGAPVATFSVVGCTEAIPYWYA